MTMPNTKDDNRGDSFAASHGSASGPPQRRYVMTLKLGADSIEELCSALQLIAFDIDAENVRQSVSGGCGAGWNYDIAENEEMAHDKYVEALNEYLAARERRDGTERSKLSDRDERTEVTTLTMSYYCYACGNEPCRCVILGLRPEPAPTREEAVPTPAQPLLDILAKLVEAADILLNDHDYDGHGWEEIAGCRDRAKAILAAQNARISD